MSGSTGDLGGQVGRDKEITSFVSALVGIFGTDACAVVERQLEVAGDEPALTIWTEIWERLCVETGRPT